MSMLDLGEEEFATILDVSAIKMRFSHGSLTTTIGTHPELGAFAVTQTMADLGREFILVTSADHDVAIKVLDEWGALSSADEARFAAEARLDRLAPGSQG